MRAKLLLILSALVPIFMLIPLALAGSGGIDNLIPSMTTYPQSTPFQAKPAEPPVLVTPGDGEIITTNSVVFSVQAMYDADTIEYKVFLPNGYFLKKRLGNYQSWTLTLADGNYSWEARGLNVYGFGPVSERRNFSVAGGLAPSPTGPSPTYTPTSSLSDQPFRLISPLLGEQVLSPVTFEFSLGAGTNQLAALTVYDAYGNTAAVLDSSTCCTVGLPAGYYTWEVTGCRPMGCATSPTYFFSVLRSPPPTSTPTLSPTAERPPAPTPLSPQHRSYTTNPFPLFSWTTVSGAVRYRIMVFDHKKASERTVDIRENSPVPSIQLSVPLQPDRYFWRLRARANGRWSLWSVRFTLWVVDELPPTATFTYTSTDSHTPMPTLTFTPVSPTGPGPSITPSLSSATPDVPTATFTSTGTPPNTPAPSATVTEPVIDPPVLLKPDDMQLVTSDTVSFKVQSPPNAIQITFEITDSDQNVLMVETQYVAINQYYWLTVPMDGQLYREFKWRVRGENQFGVGPWSDYRSFQVQLPAESPTATLTPNLTFTYTPT